jgi:hypothetical protein
LTAQGADNAQCQAVVSVGEIQLSQVQQLITGSSAFRRVKRNLTGCIATNLEKVQRRGNLRM